MASPLKDEFPCPLFSLSEKTTFVFSYGVSTPKLNWLIPKEGKLLPVCIKLPMQLDILFLFADKALNNGQDMQSSNLNHNLAFIFVLFYFKERAEAW